MKTIANITPFPVEISGRELPPGGKIHGVPVVEIDGRTLIGSEEVQALIDRGDIWPSDTPDDVLAALDPKAFVPPTPEEAAAEKARLAAEAQAKAEEKTEANRLAFENGQQGEPLKISEEERAKLPPLDPAASNDPATFGVGTAGEAPEPKAATVDPVEPPLMTAGQLAAAQAINDAEMAAAAAAPEPKASAKK